MISSRNKHVSLPTFLAGFLAVFTVLSGLFLTSPKTSAESSGGVDLTLTFPEFCSLTVTPADNHTITLEPTRGGTIGSSNIKAICNDTGGLAVYTVGFTGDTYGNTDLTYTLNNNTWTIPTGASSSPTNSQWNMTLAAVSGTYTPTIVTGFDAAHIVPDQYTKVVYRNSMTDSGDGATGANFTATYGVYIGAGQAPGTYTGTVKYLLVHPNVLAWVEDQQNPGTMVPDEVQADTLVYMQGWTGCSSLEPNSTTILVDRRDGTPYTVARLVDDTSNPTYSECWMTQNLRLDFSSSAIANQSVSDLESYTNNPASGFWSSAKSTAATNNFPWSRVNAITYSKFSIGVTTIDSLGHTYDEYGIYYNWYTATAGRGTTSISSRGSTAAGDICPSGWSLPTGDNNGEFMALNNAINGGSDNDNSGLISSPANFLYSRMICEQSIYTDSGGYWSKMTFNNEQADALCVGDFFSPVGIGPKSCGLTVRCINRT